MKEKKAHSGKWVTRDNEAYSENLEIMRLSYEHKNCTLAALRKERILVASTARQKHDRDCLSNDRACEGNSTLCNVNNPLPSTAP